MISTSEICAVLLFGVSFLVFLCYLAGRRPVIFVGFFFIIFTLAWRASATMFIDLGGPVYSSQLERTIGPGTATVIHSLAYFLTLLPFLHFFRPSVLERWRAEVSRDRTIPGMISLSDVTFVVSVLFVTLLFFDLFYKGTIPFFDRIERFNYAGGSAHRWLFRYGNFLTFWWGTIFAASRIRDGRPDWRMLGLLAATAVYAFLTGNRFSAFYSHISFFVVPWAAVLVLQQANDASAFSWVTRNFTSKASWLAALGLVLALSGTIAFAVYNNLTNVRGFKEGEVWRQAFDRVLIQPSEVGWASFERVFQARQSEPQFVFRFLFQEPIAAERNTSIQYLMFASVGEPRTSDHILRGFQFAGGFPEIFFELFGPYLAWPFLFGAGCVSAALSAIMIRGIIQGRFASAFLSLYVLYGFYVMYIGGMLNFVMPLTYWLKIAALIAALAIEWTLAQRGLQLVPWALFWVPKFGRQGKPH
jgi:hypothetical protein